MLDKRKKKLIAFILALVNIFTSSSFASSIILENIEYEEDDYMEEIIEDQVIEEIDMDKTDEEVINKQEENYDEDEKENNEKIGDIKVDHIDIKTDKIILTKKIVDEKIVYAENLDGYILISKDYKEVENKNIEFYYYPMHEKGLEYTLIKHMVEMDGKYIEIKNKDMFETIDRSKIQYKNENIDGYRFKYSETKEINNNFTLIEKYYEPESNRFSMEEKTRERVPQVKEGYIALKDGMGNDLLDNELVKELKDILDIPNIVDDIFIKDKNGNWTIRWMVELSDDDSCTVDVYVDPYIYNKVMKEKFRDYKLVTENPRKIVLLPGENDPVEFIFERQVGYKIRHILARNGKRIGPDLKGIVGLNSKTKEKFNSITAKVIPGYEPINYLNKFDLNFEDGYEEMDFVYEKSYSYDNKGHYFIRYMEVDEDGSETGNIFLDKLVITGNDPISKENIHHIDRLEARKAPELYELLDKEVIYDINLEGNGEEIVFKYRQDKGRFNINFIDDSTGLPIASSQMKTGSLGDELDLTGLIDDMKSRGYEFVGDKNQLKNIYKKDDRNLNLNFNKLENDSIGGLNIFFLDDYSNSISLKDPIRIQYDLNSDNLVNLKDIVQENETILYGSEKDEYHFYGDMDKKIRINNNMDKNIILKYRKKVNLSKIYRDVDNNEKIIVEDNIEYFQGEMVDESYKPIDGYMSLEPRKQMRPINSNMEIIFDYRSMIQSAYTSYKISHIDKETGEKIGPDITGTGKIDDEIHVYGQNIIGYELMEPRELLFNIDSNPKNNEYILEYKKCEIESNHYIIRYRDVDDKGKVYGSVYPNRIVLLEEGKLPQTVRVEARNVPENYKLVGNKIQDIDIEKNGQIIDIDYEKVKSEIKIYYLDKEDKKGIRKPNIRYYEIGKNIDIESLSIPGYKPVYDDSINIKVSREDKEYNIWYEKDEEGIDGKRTLIINHLDNFDERVVAETNIIQEEDGFYHLKPKDEIKVAEKSYRPVLNQKEENIDFNSNSEDFKHTNLIVRTYRYDKMINYLVRHYDNETYEEIIDKENKLGRFGHVVEETAKDAIDKYKALSPEIQKLFLGDKDILQEVVFRYEEEKDEVEEDKDTGGGMKPDPKPEPEKPEEKPENKPEENEDRPDWNSGGIGPDGKELDLDNLDPEVIAKELNFIDHFNYVIGYPDKTVRPERNVTREEVAAMTLRIMNKDFIEAVNTTDNDFSDVISEGWSEIYISTMARVNILEGYKDGKFKPKNDMTRAELAVLVTRLNNLNIDDMSEKIIFKDTKDHWALKPINIAAEKGWIEGYEDGTFKPNEPVSRAELVTLINNMLGRQTDLENMLDDRKEYKDLEEFRWYYEAIQEAVTPHEYIEENGKEIWTKIYETTYDVFGVLTYKHDDRRINN